MADFRAEGGAGGNGHRLSWSLVFDDAANTVQIIATHTKFDGSQAVSDPQQATITFTINTGASVAVDLLTGAISPGGSFDGGGKIINDGPRTRTNVRLRISADRAAAIFHSTQYQPPA